MSTLAKDSIDESFLPQVKAFGLEVWLSILAAMLVIAVLGAGSEKLLAKTRPTQVIIQVVSFWSPRLALTEGRPSEPLPTGGPDRNGRGPALPQAGPLGAVSGLFFCLSWFT